MRLQFFAIYFASNYGCWHKYKILSLSFSQFLIVVSGWFPAFSNPGSPCGRPQAWRDPCCISPVMRTFREKAVMHWSWHWWRHGTWQNKTLKEVFNFGGRGFHFRRRQIRKLYFCGHFTAANWSSNLLQQKDAWVGRSLFTACLCCGRSHFMATKTSAPDAQTHALML